MQMLGERFANFVKERPLSVMIRGMFESAFSPQRVDEIFEQAALSQYTRDLRFSTVVNLMTKVVFDISPSVGAAYKAAKGTIGVSEVSVYSKLNGVEPRVAAAMVHDSVERFAEVVVEMNARLEPMLAGYRVRIIDGNHFAATEHRIKELRTVAAGPLPGKALVVLDPQLKLATHVIPCEDGHAQERSLLAVVGGLVNAGDLWLADRNFCTTGLLFGIADRGACFLIRQHGNLTGEALGDSVYVGRCETGEVYEQLLKLSDAQTGETMNVRRISVKLDKATRDGDRELHLLSNVPESDASAVELAELYRKRWKIETLFQELTTTLKCEIKALGYPRAAILGFSLALVAYNAISVVQAALRATHGRQKIEEGVSGYYINLEFRSTYDGMMIAIPEPHWAIFRTLGTRQMSSLLLELSKNVQLSKYPKSRRGPKKPRPEREDIGSPHVSTARLLAKRKQKPGN